jgi:hypothetical protein
MGQQVLLTRWYFCITLDGVTTENTTTLIFTVVIASELKTITNKKGMHSIIKHKIQIKALNNTSPFVVWQRHKRSEEPDSLIA